MRLIAVILAFFVASCGFTPLYGNLDNGSNSASPSQSVKIIPVQGRLGQLLTNSLTEKLYYPYSEDNSLYELKFEVNEELNQYGFNPDRSTTRESYTQTVNYQLINQETQEVLTTGVAVARTSYDVAQSDFSNFTAKQDAQNRMVEEISQKITIRIAVFFNNRSE